MSLENGQIYAIGLARLVGAAAKNEIDDDAIDEMLDATARALGFMAALKANGSRAEAENTIYAAENVAHEVAQERLLIAHRMRTL